MKRMTMVSVGLVVVGIFGCVSNAFLDYPGRVISQTGDVVSSVVTNVAETPAKTADLAGVVLIPVDHPEN